jgi:hypothetical protein
MDQTEQKNKNKTKTKICKVQRIQIKRQSNEYSLPTGELSIVWSPNSDTPRGHVPQNQAISFKESLHTLK